MSTKKKVIVIVAIILFIIIPVSGYSQSDWWKKGNSKDSAQNKSNNVRVGDTIIFGRYKNKDIEWNILELKDGKALLFSIDSICSLPYNPVTSKYVTWGNCYLRNWLNTEFLSTAFNRTQQARIQLTQVDNSIKQQRDIFQRIEGQPNTNDYVYILSWQEVAYYFPTENHRKMKEGSWWSRSAGEIQGSALEIGSDGKMTYWCNSTSDESGIHPVLWLDLE